MSDCGFCKIVRNEKNSYCVYEDKIVKAFLDTNPWTRGHTLIIPKDHYADIFDIPEEELKWMIVITKRLATFYRKVFRGCDINIIQSNGKNAQQDIFHFHIHLVPRYKSDKQKIYLRINKNLKNDILSTFKKIKSEINKTKNPHQILIL